MTRYLTNRGEGVHPLEVDPVKVEPAPLTEDQQAAEDERIANAPLTEEPSREPREPKRSVDHETDWSALSDKEVPRHDRYADENSPWPTPARVVPATPTNANPTFADYAVPQQDRPGYADGTDAKDVSIATGEPVRDPDVEYAEPEGPKAGEGSFIVRPPTEEATGITSPIGDVHNDPADARIADTYEEAKDVSAAREQRLAEEEKGRTEPESVTPEPTLAEQPEAPTEPMEPVQDEPEPDEVPEETTEERAEGDEVEMPAGNASTDEWRRFAVDVGMSQEQADSMSRDELREHYWAEADGA